MRNAQEDKPFQHRGAVAKHIQPLQDGKINILFCAVRQSLCQMAYEYIARSSSVTKKIWFQFCN